MNISTDFEEIVPALGKRKEGYEWWYFDGLSWDGNYGFVIIFYQDNPFSLKKIKSLKDAQITPKAHPAISVSVYENSKTIYYSFLEFDERDFSWDQEAKILEVGGNKVTYERTNNDLKFRINLEQELASGHGITGMISGEAVLPANKLIEFKEKAKHSWNLLTPSVDIKAGLRVDGSRGREEIVFEGRGYHDHNTGNELMKDSFKDWYWGRYHFEDVTLVYYLMQKHTGQQFEGWLIDKNSQAVLEHFKEAQLDYFTLNWYGLKSARKISFEKEQISVNIQCKDKIDDGPFYQRFIGDLIIRYKGQVQAAHGISEYIYPKNIHKKLFWPLVNMRLRYMEERPHWVQKSKLLYTWTW